MMLGGHDFPPQTMSVVCRCVAEGQPVRIYQNADDGVSMVCGQEHGSDDLRNMCIEHLAHRPELSALPKVDLGFGACLEADGIWHIFEDYDGA